MRRALVIVLVALSSAAALGQDLSARKGFSVRITSPQPNDVLRGELTIRAEVTARREDEVARVDFYVDDVMVFSDTEPPYQVVHNFGKRSPAKVIRVVAHHRNGPTASDFVITKAADFQYVVNVQRVLLDVSVRDENRRVVTGLGPADFSVTEDGRPQKVLLASPERRPVLVGILLDTSGSMRERIKEAQDAACRFVYALEEKDRAFVIDFDEQVTLLEETTSDRTQLCRAIRQTSAVGGTALWDAVHAAYRVIHESPAERRALVVLSDGDDTESRMKFEELMEEARLNDVTVYGIGLDVGSLTGARDHLATLTEETGGRVYFVKKADELAGTYEVIAEELRTLYQLVYASDNSVYDSRFLRISVAVQGGKRYDIRHRTGYMAVEP